MAGLDPSSRSFTLALGLSVLLHAMALSIHFKLPDIILDKYLSQPLEVVLVNSKTRAKPAVADVLAQANLDGGGNTDENRRAKTPLPVPQETEPGPDSKGAAQRVRELEAQQLKMMTELQAAKLEAQQLKVITEVQAAKSVPTLEQPEPAPAAEAPQPQISGRDLATSVLKMASMEAQISRQLEEYNKRPRKMSIGSRAKEYRFAQYVEDWRLKVERVGNLNYPDDARGRVYGSLVLQVTIKSDGNLDAVEVRSSSGHPILDRAAERIVKMASPYASFPASIRRDTDILIITRTWTFAPGDKLFGE
jgi:protein TonB